MERQYGRKLILEDGRIFDGYAFGGKADKVITLVFHTAMVGYEEIVSDPAFADLGVLMSYTMIGNYGIADEDIGSKAPALGALIVGEQNEYPSNFRSTKTLEEVLEENNIPGLEGIDTRALTRHLREKGAMRALITDDMRMTSEEGVAKIKATPVPVGAAARVSCRKRYFARTPDHIYNVVVVDCGVKPGLLRALNRLFCNVTVVPFDTPAADILAMRPHGILLSNAPGCPLELTSVAELVRTLDGKVPVLGVGMGAAVLAMSYGVEPYRLKGGHFGGNHPVKDLRTDLIEVCAQNHMACVKAEDLADKGLQVTHLNLLDNTVEGFADKAGGAMGIFFSPESLSAGPAGSTPILNQFVTMMKEAKCHA